MDRTREFRRFNENEEPQKAGGRIKIFVVILIIVGILTIKFMPISGTSDKLYAVTNTSTDFIAMFQEIKQVIKKHTVKTFFKMPVEGVITCGYGERNDPFTGEKSQHTGIDIDAVEGTKVMCAGNGEIFDVSTNEYYGNYMIVLHENNTKTLYGHLTSAVKQKGDKVVEGEEIAISGNTGRSTGPHLHFEVRVDDKVVDPTGFLKK